MKYDYLEVAADKVLCDHDWHITQADCEMCSRHEVVECTVCGEIVYLTTHAKDA